MLVSLTLLFAAALFGGAWMVSRKIGVSLIIGILAAAMFFIFQPTLAADFPMIWLIAGACFAIGGGFAPLFVHAEGKELVPYGMIVLISLGIFAIPCVGSMFGSSELFRASDYRAIIGTVNEGQFATDVEPLDQSQVRIVDSALAMRRAEELLGAQEGLGSRTRIGTPTIQSIAGKLYWAAPLDHSAFMTWLQNTTTPGFVLVSATNIQDARLVLDHPIAYGPGNFYISHDLKRLLRASGYADKGITDFQFEVDDSFNPHWVVTVYEHKVGFSGAKATGVVIVDPETGANAYYDTDHLPAWVDRAQPEDMLREQIADWGQYVHGYWNATGFGSRQDVVAPTKEMSLVYGSDGRAKWYTGIQSTGQDQGTIGFMLIDSRTGKATFYRKNGVTEDGAKKAIEGKVANFAGYTSTYPILYNVDGAPIFITTIKDGDGNFKGIGIASAQNRAIVVVGDTVSEALRKYEAAARLQGTASAVESGGLASRHAGHVARIGAETIDGRTTWFVTLDNEAGTIFQVPAGLSPATPITQAGDEVALEAYDAKGGMLEARSFANERLTPADGPNTVKAKAYNQSVDQATEVKRDADNLDARIRSMSPEEKDRLLRTLSQQPAHPSAATH